LVTLDPALYGGQARKRAVNLSARFHKIGSFIADDHGRPFWHASDARQTFGYRHRIIKRYVLGGNGPVRTVN